MYNKLVAVINRIHPDREVTSLAPNSRAIPKLNTSYKIISYYYKAKDNFSYVDQIYEHELEYMIKIIREEKINDILND